MEQLVRLRRAELVISIPRNSLLDRDELENLSRKGKKAGDSIRLLPRLVIFIPTVVYLPIISSSSFYFITRIGDNYWHGGNLIERLDPFKMRSNGFGALGPTELAGWNRRSFPTGMHAQRPSCNFVRNHRDKWELPAGISTDYKHGLLIYL